jgi:hypothetical protein
MVMSATCRRNVDLPPMFGPVMSRMRASSPACPPNAAVVGREGAPPRAQPGLDGGVAPGDDARRRPGVEDGPDEALLAREDRE